MKTAVTCRLSLALLHDEHCLFPNVGTFLCPNVRTELFTEHSAAEVQVLGTVISLIKAL